MLEVKFYDSAPEEKLKFAVIAGRSGGKWVFCKHRQRDTYEIPGGHREQGETIDAAARREFYEETGAAEYDIKPVCVYSVTGKNRVNDTGEETFGMLYFAEVFSFDELPASEMERVCLFEQGPPQWTYPEIQPHLLRRVEEFLG